MQGTVDGFGYGAVTPLVAFLMACLGGALGLRCITRSLLLPHSRRPVWLALGAAALGCGIWSMHFIAMMGFSIERTPVHYNQPITYASLGLAVVMVGVGVFIVGYRGATGGPLFTGGTVTGLGVASMHYLGMAGMRFHGQFVYSIPMVVASVVIGVAAAVAALWAAGRARGLLPTLGASLLMGAAVSGMHYTAMAALSVHLDGTAETTADARTTAALVPMLIGPLVMLVLVGVVVILDPMLVVRRPAPVPVERRPGVPAAARIPRTASHQGHHPVRRPVRQGARTPQNR
ncbi:MHYT domain-containing protein [Streptomyces sp. RM1]